MKLVLLIAAGLVSGVISGMGIGGGIVLIPVLTGFLGFRPKNRAGHQPAVFHPHRRRRAGDTLQKQNRRAENSSEINFHRRHRRRYWRILRPLFFLPYPFARLRRVSHPRRLLRNLQRRCAKKSTPTPPRHKGPAPYAASLLLVRAVLPRRLPCTLVKQA